MDWGKWIDGLLRDLGLAVIPVLTAALTRLADGASESWWIPAVATALLVALKRLGNWVKHRDYPAPV
jgi:hypothetical protein